jgi:hypothetical protein
MREHALYTLGLARLTDRHGIKVIGLLDTIDDSRAF